MIDRRQRRADKLLQMPHSLHGAVLFLCGLGQEKKPVQLRFLTGKPDVLHSHAQKGDLFLQACVCIAVIHTYRRGIDLLLDAVHGLEGGKNGLGGRAQLIGQGFCRQSADPLGSHHSQGGLHHFFFCEFILRSHRPDPFT